MRSSDPGIAWHTGAALAGAAYVLLPGPHHLLLTGIPLSIPGAAALLLALAWLALPSPRTAERGRGITIAFALTILVKIALFAAVPPPGFRGEYFPTPDFTGAPFARVDRRLDFDATTFRREFFNEAAFVHAMHPEALPFSVVWRGGIALPQPTRLVGDAAGSEPVRVGLDGEAIPAGPVAGAHEVVVRFARVTAAPPAARVEIRTGGGTEVPVFAGRVQPWQAALAKGYRPVSLALDALLLLVLVWGVGQGMVQAWAAEGRRRWEPPLAVAGVAVVAFWFAVGALRTGPRFAAMEFQSRGDDWLLYEAIARRIAAGDLLGGRERIFSSSFTYPYWVGGLHVLFGEPLWPVYFGQYLAVGLACLALGWLGKMLWGVREATAVLAAATGIAVLDVARWYPLRLLSENLALLVVPVMFLGLHAYVTRPGVGTGAVAGALLAGAVLTRFNLLPFAALALAYLVWRRLERAAPGAKLALVAGVLLSYALFPLRERLASGTWGWLPTGSTMFFTYTLRGSVVEQWRHSWLGPLRDTVLPNLAFMLGYPKLLEPVYAIRPHWLVLWAAYAVWTWTRRREAHVPAVLLLHAFVFVYVGTMSISPVLTVYGYRHLLALVFTLGLFVPSASSVVARCLRPGTRHVA